MQFLETLIALIVTLGILVTIHEYGHFLVARRCGVRVLRFSVGFGRPLYSWYDRQGTEFAVAAIPLGGYVKMLDEREGPVPEDQLHLTFNRQSPGRRIAIASAGPLANFLFAVFAYWLLNLVGYTVVAPVVGEVKPESPAQRMGLEPGMEILAVDGERTDSWRQVGMALLQRAGDPGRVRMELAHEGGRVERSVTLQNWLSGLKDPDPVRLFGIEPWRPPLEPVLDRVVPGGAAAAAGLQAGDRILAVNGQGLENWQQFVEVVRASPGETLAVTIAREAERLELSLTPAERNGEEGAAFGYIGAGVQPPDWPEDKLRYTRHGPLAAVPQAVGQFWSDTELTLVAIQKMVTGLLSVQNLSGPITIARVAEATVSSGFEDFIRFLAYLSISLGILNLLPIPVLDGGHILFYTIEAIRGRPLSEAAQAFGVRLGMALILALMFFALYNDLMRL